MLLLLEEGRRQNAEGKKRLEGRTFFCFAFAFAFWQTTTPSLISVIGYQLSVPPAEAGGLKIWKILYTC